MNRLRWQCRRGMRELDLLLQRFLDAQGDLDALGGLFADLVAIGPIDVTSFSAGYGAVRELAKVFTRMPNHVRQVACSPK